MRALGLIGTGSMATMLLGALTESPAAQLDKLSILARPDREPSARALQFSISEAAR
jgi:pyrroline-5-carboxylate reductase